MPQDGCTSASADPLTAPTPHHDTHHPRGPACAFRATSALFRPAARLPTTRHLATIRAFFFQPPRIPLRQPLKEALEVIAMFVPLFAPA